MVLLEPLDGPLLVLRLGLPEPALLDVVEHLSELLGVEVDRRVEVLRDQRPDILVRDLWLPALGVGDESRSVVDAVDDTHRCLENGVRVHGDRDHRAERHRRMWFWEVGGLDVLDVAEHLLHGRVGVDRWVVWA